MAKQDPQGSKDSQVRLSVPGRLCLFGEHSDWASDYSIHRGFCIVTGTDQSISAIALPSDEFVVETKLPDNLGRPSGRTRQMSCLWKDETLLAAAKDETEFFRYTAGVAYQMLSRLNLPGGVDIRITRMDLPLKKGVSSSAAVCILVAKAFDAVYDLRKFPHELMELAYLGERLTGSQCGQMDQACIYGKTPVLLVFEKSKHVRIEPISTSADINMFFVDLAGKKDTVRILADLQNSYLESKELQQALGEENERIVRLAYQAMLSGDAAGLGALMAEAQRNFDKLVAPHSPDDLKSPLLHKVLNFEGITEHIYGGKGVGSQGDGTAQFVARSVSDRDAAMAKIESDFPQMRCFPLTIPQGAFEST
jgi:galactokinase